MTVINTNVNSLIAANASTKNARALSAAMEQLSTGSRINKAADDAAGLAIAQTMTAQIRGLDMAVRNANDATSLLQTADGAMIEQTNMLQRMRELAVQASTDTVSATQKGYLQTEFADLQSEINRIAGNTQWNGMNILNASAGSSGAFTFQVGANSGQTISVTIASMTNSGSNLSAVLSSGLKISSLSGASGAITTIDSALDTVNNLRATIGATQNQLTYAADNLTNISQNASASRSRVTDTDYAAATSQLAKNQIISQAATAMLAQANQQPQTVLALLK